MDNTIFNKLKAKQGMTATLLYAPPEYPGYEGFSGVKDGKSDFVHLFVTSKAELSERIIEAAEAVTDGGLLWLSYPKSAKAQKYDINRDSLWDLVIQYGWHPVAQVSLDDNWSAMRLKKNDEGVVYERPGMKGKSC